MSLCVAERGMGCSFCDKPAKWMAVDAETPEYTAYCSSDGQSAFCDVRREQRRLEALSISKVREPE